MKAVFLRLLSASAKGVALQEAVDGLRAGSVPPDTAYEVAPGDLSTLPGTPLAYWVSDRLRRLFSDHPPTEGNGRTVKQGLATADDFRFLRLWWEVAGSARLDSYAGPDSRNDMLQFQAWCRERTKERPWAPLAKGGEYSPYFSDIHLVINWGHDGEELKAWADPLYGNSGWSRIVKNVGFYFRPGLTWPERTTSGYCPQALPPGVVISVRGQGIYLERQSAALALLAAHSTRVYQYLEEVLIGLGEESVSGSAARDYTGGSIGRLPYPAELFDTHGPRLEALARELFRIRVALASQGESSWLFGTVLDRGIGLRANVMAMFVTEMGLIEKGVHEAAAVEMLVRETLQLDSRCVQEIGSVTGPHPVADLPSIDESDLTSRLSDALDRSVDELVDEAVDAGYTGRGVTKKSYFISRFHELLAQRWNCSAVSVVSAHRAIGRVRQENYQDAARALVSYLVGAAFGRWDIRLVAKPELRRAPGDPFAPLPPSPPAMLVDPDGLPATRDRIASEAWLAARPDAVRLPVEVPTPRSVTQAEYPLEVAWDGLLVDDPGGVESAPPATWDIEQRARAVLKGLWSHLAPSVEAELGEILGVARLGEYLRSPSGFFADHLSLYSRSRRKAPIYWPLSTASGGYTVWLYYPRLSDDLLHRAINDHISPKIADLEQHLARLESGAGQEDRRKASRQITELRGLAEELRQLREDIQQVAALPYRPDLDDGVLISACPLWRLFRLTKWRSELEETWKELEAGKYDWAHLAHAIWPSRVEAACRGDLSLAIAHNRRDLFAGGQPKAKAKRGGQRATRKKA